MLKRIAWILLVLAIESACSRETEVPPGEQHSPGRATDEREMRTLKSSDLNLRAETSTAVISSAQKFIIPVPAWGRDGEPLTYPKGHEREGRPILDFQGNPVGDRGLVFFNNKDKSWQAVASDGNGVIIVNETSPEQAGKLDQKLRSFADDPGTVMLTQLKLVLGYAQDELGLSDMYNSTRSFIRTKMSRVFPDDVPLTHGKEIADYGLYKRDDRDVCYAVYVPGRFSFEGPAGTPQIFEDGGVIVEQNGERRGVQPDIFVRTYRLRDGESIESATRDLKHFSP